MTLLHDETKAANNEEADEHDENLEKTIAIVVDLSGNDLDEDDIDECAGGEALQHSRHEHAYKAPYGADCHADADTRWNRRAEHEAELDDGATRDVLSCQ